MVRLSRTGRTNIPTFSVVVTEKTNAAKDGNILEKVGTYSPAQNPPVFRVERDRIDYYLSRGATLSETLARLLKKEGAPGMEKFVDFKKRYQIKKKGAAPEVVEKTDEPKA